MPYLLKHRRIIDENTTDIPNNENQVVTLGPGV